MLKILTTQLSGLLKGLQEREELNLEDAARLLSQAIVGEGVIYIFGHREMNAVATEALLGQDRLNQMKPLVQDGEIADIHSADRVLLITQSSADQETISYAKQLSSKGIPFVAISTVDEHDQTLAELADIHLNLGIKGGLVPTDSGERIGYPATIVALYTYLCLRCLIADIIAEYE